jgi:DNA-binding NarL/FixJ family response regulator
VRAKRTFDRRGPDSHPTKRDYEVLEGLRQGLSTAEIAKRMRVNSTNVKQRLAWLTRYFGLGKTANRVRVAVAWTRIMNSLERAEVVTGSAYVEPQGELFE